MTRVVGGLFQGRASDSSVHGGENVDLGHTLRPVGC